MTWSVCSDATLNSISVVKMGFVIHCPDDNKKKSFRLCKQGSQKSFNFA